jgi:hypothetical protein
VKSIRNSLALMLTGVLHILSFGAAGVLSSHLATFGNEVLLAPSRSCGVVSVIFIVPLAQYFVLYSSFGMCLVHILR